MFEYVHAPSKFFGPLVAFAEIARETIKLVEKGDSGEVALPLYSRYIQVLGCLPYEIQHIVRRWSRLDTADQDGGTKAQEKAGKQ